MKKILLSIIGLGFFARLTALFALNRHLIPETFEYDKIALNLLHKHQYLFFWNNTDYYSQAYPLYPMLTALSHMLTRENYFVLELLHIALSAATIYFIYAIAKKIFDERAGLTAAFLLALHPGLVVYSTKLHELTLVAFLISFIFWYILRADQEKPLTAVVTGLLTGAGILTRPTFLFFLPAYGAYLALSRKAGKHTVRMFLIASLISMLMIVPWTVRNYLIHNKLIFITTNSAELFWRGNNPAATGTGLTEDMKTMPELAPKEFMDKLYSLDEVGQYDLFYRETIKYIKSDPAHFMKMIAKKIYYFWWFSPQTGILYPHAWTFIYKLYYVFLFVFFWVGVYKALRLGTAEQKAATISILVFFVFVTAAHSFYYVEMRHRWAIESLMLMFTAGGIMALSKK